MSYIDESQTLKSGRVSRIVGATGRFLVSAGLVVLTFTVYQLWGTGLLQDRTQSALAAEFDELQTGAGPTVTTSPSTVPAEVDTAVESVETTPAAEPVVVPAAALRRDRGEVIGRVRADRIDLDQYVVEGVGTEELEAGPGHYGGTPMPGMAGNASLAGHRTTWGAPFSRIDELQPGDAITVDMAWGTAVYEVDSYDDGAGGQVGHFIVEPSEVWVLDQGDVNRLTMTSCHPKFSARQRIIVTATLISEPVSIEGGFTADLPDSLADEDFEVSASAAPRTASGDLAGRNVGTGVDGDRLDGEAEATGDFGGGLSGDRRALGPAVAWSLAAIALWSATRVAARRWRSRLPFVLAALPIAAVWFVAFTYIDQVIPSY